jgi:hypothetical protein
MNLAPRIALAAVLAAATVAPAAADEWWTYRGGPDYGGPYAYYGGGPYAEPGYGGAYAYYGPRYGYRYGYGYRGRVNEPLYRCTGPATSDCYNSRALQGTR